MIGKLPESEVWKQSDLDRPGLRFHLRYLSTDPLLEFMLELQGGPLAYREVLQTLTNSSLSRQSYT
jgi:hypothetical protein